MPNAHRLLKQLTFTLTAVSVGTTLMQSSNALAWGRQGHSMVAEAAAILLADQDPRARFLKERAYDLGFYANVPDLVWKKPETYQVEWTNHFMDLEVFARAFRATEKKTEAPNDPFELDRLKFQAHYPGIKIEAGRAWWRIRELDAKLDGVASRLRRLTENATRDERQALQADWLMTAGEMAHYVGDMSQPLHCTENHDGQMSNQKGIHSFYEDQVVDDIFPAVQDEVAAITRSKWRTYSARMKDLSTLAVIRDLTEGARLELPNVLKIDMRVGRNLKNASTAYKKQIAHRLASGALALAELWRRQLGWTYDGEKFYAFDGKPAFVYPPGTDPATPPAPAPKPPQP